MIIAAEVKRDEQGTGHILRWYEVAVKLPQN
jgi:hypothetical protein